MWGIIVFSSAGEIERERRMGTLESISAVPADFKLILTGKIFGNTLSGFFTMILGFIFITFVFGIPIIIKNPLLLILSLIVSMWAFVVISLFLAGIFTLSRSSRALVNSLEYPIFILCGFVFSLDVLPSLLRPLSYSLLPTWAVILLRKSIFGVSNLEEYFQPFGILLGLIIIYSILGNIFFKIIDKRTRISGTLGVY
jgi:ABC-2 type transport system permease protein